MLIYEFPCGKHDYGCIHELCVYAGMLFCGLVYMFNFIRRLFLAYVICLEPHAGILVGVYLSLWCLSMFVLFCF